MLRIPDLLMRNEKWTTFPYVVFTGDSIESIIEGYCENETQDEIDEMVESFGLSGDEIEYYDDSTVTLYSGERYRYDSETGMAYPVND